MALKRGENTKKISVASKYANTSNPKVIIIINSLICLNT